MVRRGLVVLVGLAVLVTGVVVYLAVRDPAPEASARTPVCGASVEGTRVEIDLEQARYASLIAASAIRRGMPARATTIAIATAYQESHLRNVDYGDRDSLGLFQQRPSQGWGTAAQVRDPRYATDAFLAALAQIDGYTSMEVTDAAQRVQRSAFGNAYAQHEPYSRVLASALSGNSRAAFSCEIDPPRSSGDSSRAAGRLRADVRRSFGAAVGPVEVSAATGTGSSASSGDGRPLAYAPAVSGPAGRTTGWALAQYLVANAARFDIESVSFDGRTWSAARSPAGWRSYATGASDDTARVRVTVA